MKHITAIAAAALALFASHANAQSGLNLGALTKNATYFAGIGFNNAGYTSSGLALKAGADFGAGFAGPKEVGLTAFYAYGGASDSYNLGGCNGWDISSHTIATGPTFNLPIQGSPITLQARATLALTLWNIDFGCSYIGEGSGTAFDLGYGIGASYKLNDRLTLRADWDSVGWSADQFTIGANFKF